MRAHLPILVLTLVCPAGCGDGAHATESISGLETTTEMLSTSSSSTGAAATDDPTADESTTGEPTTGASTTDSSTTAPEVFSYEGEHVVVISDPELELCGGTMAHMDNFVARMSGALGMQPPVLDERIRFTWVPDWDELKSLCSFEEEVLGCAKGDRAFSQSAPHNHELAHTLAFRRTKGRSLPFFSEGIAVAYEGMTGRALPRPYLSNSADTEIVDLMQMSTTMLGNTEGGYLMAGRFSAYLIAEHGITKYLDLYSALAADKSFENIDPTMQKVLGVSLDQSIAGFGPPWSDHYYDPLLTECNAPEVPWDGQFLEMAEWVYCERDNAIGPYRGDVVALEYTIVVPESGTYELRIKGDEQEATIVPDFDFGPFVGVSIVPCGAGKWGFMETKVNGTPRIGGLFAGRNSLRLLTHPDVIWEVAFTLKRVM